MKRPHIPRTWTDEQALQVAAFLQDLIDDIWQVYGSHLPRTLYDDPRPDGADDTPLRADNPVEPT